MQKQKMATPGILDDPRYLRFWSAGGFQPRWSRHLVMQDPDRISWIDPDPAWGK